MTLIRDKEKLFPLDDMVYCGHGPSTNISIKE